MKRKKTGLIGLYSGRKIKSMAVKGERLTRTQTAKQALKAIKKKYITIVDSAKYYHAGGGNWVRRSKERDKKTTSKVTMLKYKWRSQPHKLDYPGIDTGPGHRTPPKSKLINYSLRNRKQILKRIVQVNGGKGVKVSVAGPTLKLSYIDGPSIENATKNAYNTIDNLCIADIKKAYPKDYGKLNINLKDYKISIDRRFSSEVQRYIKNSGVTPFDLNKENISETAFKKIKKSPMSKPGYGKVKPESKGRYRYGSFSRPLWAGFKPSVSFKVVTPLKSDEDPRRGRMPHSVIVTNKTIPRKELEDFELTDIREIKKLKEMYAYIESLNIADRHKGHLRRLYNTGKVKTKTDINKLAKKVEKPIVKHGPLYVPKIPDDVIILIGNGKIPEAETMFVTVYMKANVKVRYDDPRIKKAFDDFRKKAVSDYLEQSKTAFKMNRSLDSRLMFRSAWYAQGKPRDDKKIEAAYEKQIVKAPKKRKPEVKKIVEPAKRTKATVIKEAHEDWDEQAKALMLYKRPFDDKSLKACVNRHLKAAGY